MSATEDQIQSRRNLPQCLQESILQAVISFTLMAAPDNPAADP